MTVVSNESGRSTLQDPRIKRDARGFAYLETRKNPKAQILRTYLESVQCDRCGTIVFPPESPDGEHCCSCARHLRIEQAFEGHFDPTEDEEVIE